MMDLRAIALAYSDAPLISLDAIPAWRQLATESVRLAKRLRNCLSVRLTEDSEPYPDAVAMLTDIARGRFVVSTANSTHPVWSVDENIAFRIVHDVLGHGSTGSGFTWEGEQIAYRKHALHVSPTAGRALYIEAIGQVAYALHTGEFGPQKVAFL